MCVCVCVCVSVCVCRGEGGGAGGGYEIFTNLYSVILLRIQTGKF